MVVGWYHSHPGFGPWLSGVDVQTQQSFEALNKRAVAVVVDPIQSVKGKVVIDAFRTINPQSVAQHEHGERGRCAGMAGQGAVNEDQNRRSLPLQGPAHFFPCCFCLFVFCFARAGAYTRSPLASNRPLARAPRLSDRERKA